MSSFDFSLENICLPYYDWAVKLATSVDKPKTMLYQTSFSEGTSASWRKKIRKDNLRSKSTTVNRCVGVILVTLANY